MGETADLVDTQSLEEDGKEDLMEDVKEDISMDMKCITDMLSNIEGIETDTVDRMRKLTSLGETNEHIKEDNKRNLRDWIARTEAETEQDFEYFADDWEYSTLDCLMEDREGICQDMEDIDVDYNVMDLEDKEKSIGQIRELRDTDGKEENVTEDKGWPGTVRLSTLKTVILWTVRLLIFVTLFTFFGAFRINQSVFYPVTWSLLHRSLHIDLPRPYILVTYTSNH